VQVDNLMMLTAAKKADIIMLALYVATLQWDSKSAYKRRLLMNRLWDDCDQEYTYTVQARGSVANHKMIWRRWKS